MTKRIPRRPGISGWALPGLLLSLILAGCAGSRSYDAQPPADRGPCTSYKVGEIRGVPQGEVQRAMRRMGGDFVISRSDTPGRGSAYSGEVFRYHDPECAKRR